MPYITISNAKKIIQKIPESEFDNITEAIYKRDLYCFSSRETANLKGIRELFKDLEAFILKYYKPIIVSDSFRYITPENQPAFHLNNKCERLNSKFLNIEIPSEIRIEGEKAVLKFREWYKEKNFKDHDVKYYINELTKKYPQVGEINPKNIEIVNSGVNKIENYQLEDLENKIDNLIISCNNYFNSNPNVRDLLHRYQKLTFLAYIDGALKNNRSGLKDKDLKAFLKAFDEGFKSPLKNNLIEYYKVKFNPDLEFKGTLLNKLGFRPCSACIT